MTLHPDLNKQNVKDIPEINGVTTHELVTAQYYGVISLLLLILLGVNNSTVVMLEGKGP